MKKISVFCLVFVAFFACIFLTSCRLDIAEKIREMDRERREKIIEEATINFGTPITSGNHTWIPIDKEGLASNYTPEIISYLNAFEEKNEVEIISRDIDTQQKSGEQTPRINGIWLIHRPKDPSIIAKEKALKKESETKKFLIKKSPFSGYDPYQIWLNNSYFKGQEETRKAIGKIIWGPKWKVWIKSDSIKPASTLNKKQRGSLNELFLVPESKVWMGWGTLGPDNKISWEIKKINEK